MRVVSETVVLTVGECSDAMRHPTGSGIAEDRSSVADSTSARTDENTKVADCPVTKCIATTLLANPAN